MDLVVLIKVHLPHLGLVLGMRRLAGLASVVEPVRLVDLLQLTKNSLFDSNIQLDTAPYSNANCVFMLFGNLNVLKFFALEIMHKTSFKPLH